MKTTVRWTLVAAMCLCGCSFNRYDRDDGGMFGRRGLFGNLCGRQGDTCEVPMTAVPYAVGTPCCQPAPATCCPAVTSECCAPAVSVQGGCCGGGMGGVVVGSPAVGYDAGGSCGCSGGGMSGSPMMQMQQFEQGLMSEPGVTRILPGPANDPAIMGSQMVPTAIYGG